MKRLRFEAVVTDLGMTDGDGLAFIRDARSNGATMPTGATMFWDATSTDVTDRAPNLRLDLAR